MRILVVSAIEALSCWANAINTIKMAQGFSRLGHEVTIVCRQSPSGRVPPEKLAQMYGLTEAIHWVQLPWGIGRSPLDPHWTFSLLALPVALWLRPELVFARSYIFPWLSSKCRITTIVESHAGLDNNSPPFLRLISGARHHNALRLWVTISQRLTEHYHYMGVPKEKLIVLPDAVDLHLFWPPPHLTSSPYPTDKPIVAYVGHLYDYKGIPAILETAALLPKIHFHLVGGFPQDIERQKRRIQKIGLSNVTLHGWKPHKEVPNFLWHANVLLLPPSAKHPSAAWTSPIKLGEYLASGTPVVATAIPALRDWLTDDEVKFVSPDDAKALAFAIRTLLADTTMAQSLATAGQRKALSLSYIHRAETILQRVYPEGR